MTHHLARRRRTLPGGHLMPGMLRGRHLLAGRRGQGFRNILVAGLRGTVPTAVRDYRSRDGRLRVLGRHRVVPVGRVRLRHRVADMGEHRLAGAVVTALLDPPPQLSDRRLRGVVGDRRRLRHRIGFHQPDPGPTAEEPLYHRLLAGPVQPAYVQDGRHGFAGGRLVTLPGAGILPVPVVCSACSFLAGAARAPRLSTQAPTVYPLWVGSRARRQWSSGPEPALRHGTCSLTSSQMRRTKREAMTPAGPGGPGSAFGQGPTRRGGS